jgi:hypothetical protein
MRWKTQRTDIDPKAAHPGRREGDREVLAEGGAREESRPRSDSISADLQARGVAAPTADVLAERVGREVAPDQEGYAAVLDGIALGFRAQNAIAGELAQSASELQEIERLMSSFAGELTKLDEVLEVLAAYLRRMRTAAPPLGTRLLH